MLLSRMQAAIIALVPGVSELIENKAVGSGNLALDGTAKKIRYSRDGMYISAAIAAIATVGAIFAGATPVGIACGVVAVGSACLSAFFAKRLYDATAFLRAAINAKQTA